MENSVVEKAKSRLKFDFPYTTEEWLAKNMLMENYHKHTTWSNFVVMDSPTSIDDFIKKSQEYGCQCYFSGEHGYQGEWLNVYDICKKYDMKFRYSAEVYWVKDINEEKDNTNCHMMIIARTYNAMRKLNYIITQAHEKGFYYRPRIDLNMLFTLSPDEVYITSACIKGWAYEDATEIWLSVWEHFGDSFFLEYQTHNTEEQKVLNKRIHAIAKETGIQTIIGLDTHYLNEEEKIERDNLQKRKKVNIDGEDGWYMDFPDGNEVYRRMKEQGILSDEEIIYSMMNTQVFINGCEELSYNRDFKIPVLPEYQNMPYEDRCDILHSLLMDKYHEEDSDHQSKEREDAIEYEFGEISGSGTSDYFLSNQKLVELAINKYGGQLTTTSRGSAASYYSSKLCGFTTMDRFEAEVPIYPERFITKDRILSSHQCPDIDLNISEQKPFVDAARELFGEHGCYPLLAVGKFGEKSGFKLYADIKGIDPTTANEITSCIDDYNEALKNAEDDEKDSIDIADYITNEEYLKIFNESKSYQNIIEISKVHACGHLVFNGDPRKKDVAGYGDIRYEIGLIRCHSESTGKTTMVVNAEGGMLDLYGYVKDDFLIVDVVTIISKLYHAIGREVPTVTELRKMVSGDAPTWDLYANGYTCCLNQCEKPGTTQRAKIYKPKNIKELAAFVAGIRPGFKSLLDGFLHRTGYTNGEKAIDDILSDCFNYMLYQEAVMKIFTYLGIPMKDSYDTIKKISKKKLKGEALKHVEDTLTSHWLEKIGNLDNFEAVYTVIKQSARYSFNAPHALAMANDSLYEAWMKAHYTSVFYEVTLNHYQDKGDKNKVADLLHEATKYFHYNIKKYRYGDDNSKFVVDPNEMTISSNLGCIKGIGSQAVNDLYNIYKSGADNIVDVYIATAGTNVNATVLKKLVSIGYFSNLGSTKKLLKAIEVVDEYKGQQWSGRKTVDKPIIESLGIDVTQYATDVLASGKHSATRYTITDWVGLVKAIVDTIPEEELTVGELCKNQLEVLGYIDYVNPELSPKYIAITKLDTKYSPKFTAYCLKNGKTCEMKVSAKPNPKNKTNNNFKDSPFEDGDILLMYTCDKKPKQRKTADGWETVPGEYNWWLTKYDRIHNLRLDTDSKQE